MVLKGTKRSLRTGNTLRNTGDVQTNQRTRSVIVRHSANLSRRQRSDEADTSFLTADAVEFSLNKKGRWNLPDVIEANIKHDDDGLVRVSMLRRHRMNRQSDCLNVVTRCAAGADSDDATERCEVYSAPQRKKARRKTYCNGLNVLHSGRGKSTKDSKKKQVISTKQDLAQRERQRTASDATSLEDAGRRGPDSPSKPAAPIPQVQYDVFYPLPTSSSLRFHPKFAPGSAPRDGGIEQQLIVTAGLKSSNKGSNHRHKHVDYDDVYDQDDFYDDWGYGEECEDLHEYGYTEQFQYDQCGDHFTTDVPCRESGVLFSDVMEHAFEAALSCSAAASADIPTSRRKSRRVDKTRKRKGGRYLYQPESVDDFDSCLEDSLSDVSTELGTPASSSTPPQPITFSPTQVTTVNVMLSREATSPSVLVGLYGPRYTEAACLPRKIILDITDRVQGALKGVASFSDLYLPFLDLTACVVFTYICPASQDTNPASVAADTRPISADDNAALDTSSSYRATTATENYPSSEDIAATDNPINPLTPESSTSVCLFDVYRVQLNMNCLGQGIGVQLPHGYTTFNSLDEIVRQVLDYIVTVSPDRLSRQVCEASPCALGWRLQPDFDTVAEANGWQVSCVSLSDVVSAECSLPAAAIKQTHSPVRSSSSSSSSEMDGRLCQERANGFTAQDADSSIFPAAQPTAAASKDCVVGLLNPLPSEAYCRVCFEELALGTLQGPAATALRECQHWFCDTCWRAHLSVTARELGVARRMECPEFQCGVEVDHGTLLSLLHMRDVMLQQRRGVERKLTRMFRSKWCPNPQCGRVVQLTGKESQNVTEPTSMVCPCGERFCFRCHEVPHWPLSCDDFARYHALLQKSADLRTVPPSRKYGLVSVRGKSCPKCYLFIEKKGGCPYMTCVCGHLFFWCCRKAVKGSTYHACPDLFQVNDLTNTVKMVIKHVDTSRPKEPKRSQLYEMAVHHKACQHPKEVRLVGQRAEDLRRKLQTLSGKGVDIGAPLVAVTGQPTPLSSKKMKLAGSAPTTASQADLRVTREESREGCQAPTEAGYRLSITPENPRCALTVDIENSLASSSSSSSSAQDHRRQYVKQATCAMTKLKIELHHVIEHTAALLHLHQDSRSNSSDYEPSRATLNKVNDEMERLVFLASSLDLLLDVQSPRELRHVLPWFQCLQRDVKDTMTALARLLAGYQCRGQ